jgi:hypothetical protein
MHLVDHLCAPAQPFRQPLSQLEAEVEAVGANVKEQIARGHHGGVARACEFGQRVKPGRPGLAEKTVPEPRAKAHNAAQLALRDAKADRSPQTADIRQHAANLVLASGINRQDEEDRRLGERR